MKRRTTEETRIYIEQQGYTLLSTVYNTAHHKDLVVRCPKGHEYPTRWNDFNQGVRCPYCNGKIQLIYEQVKKYIEEQKYILLSEGYKNSYTKLNVECDKGHQYQTTWTNFQQGHRCSYCAGKSVAFEQVKKYIEEQGYILLSTRYEDAQTKLNVKCNKGHRRQITWASFQQGNRCLICSNNDKRMSYQQIEEYIEQYGYSLLSTEMEYKNNKTKLNIQCPKDHQYRATWNNFKTGHRCPLCNESKGEKKIAQILDEMNVFYIRQYRMGKTKLALDFCIPSLNVGIEYDGEHHFKPVQFGGRSIKKAEKELKKQQKRDHRKNKLCEENGYNLIRIAYNEDLTLEKLKIQIVDIKHGSIKREHKLI